jgi:hypothetical protein
LARELPTPKFHERRFEVHKFGYLVAGALCLAAAACGDDKPDTKAGFANLRAVNLSQGAPDFKIVLNDSEPTFDDLGFTDSSDYESIAVGSYTLEVIAPGDVVLYSATIELADQRNYTVVIYDRPDSLKTTLFEDVFDLPKGMIDFRLFNTAIGRGPMALYFLPEDGGTPEMLTEGVAYGEASAAVQFADGNHNIGLDVDVDGVVDVTYDLPPLSDGTIANLFAVFDENGELDLILQMNDGFTWELDGSGSVGGGVQALVRAIHLVPSAPALSIFAAGATVAMDLSFMQQSTAVGVPQGTHDITVVETEGSPLFDIMDASVEAGQSYTIVLFGNAGMPVGNLIEDDAGNIPTDRVRVRMVHVAVDVGALDFWDAPTSGDPTQLFGDLEYGEASDVVELSPGAIRIGVDVNDDSVFDVFFNTPALPAGELVNIYAVMDNGTPRLVTQMESSITAIGTTMP